MWNIYKIKQAILQQKKTGVPQKATVKQNTNFTELHKIKTKILLSQVNPDNWLFFSFFFLEVVFPVINIALNNIFRTLILFFFSFQFRYNLHSVSCTQIISCLKELLCVSITTSLQTTSQIKLQNISAPRRLLPSYPFPPRQCSPKDNHLSPLST